MIKIIAECGVNFHNLDEAFLMIKKSKEVGCWATKFQIYNDEVIKNSEHYDFLKSIMITEPEAILLVQYGHMIGQEVFFTPMYDCIAWLDTIGVNYYKIRYKDRQNLNLINKIRETKKPFFRSMDFDDEDLYDDNINEYTLFCVPKYPAKRRDYFREYLYAFDGISDHTKGTKLLKEAEDFGFEYFEKHMKLDNNCIENEWSVTFEQLKEVLHHE